MMNVKHEVTAAALFLLAAAASSASERPNVLLIVTDDQSPFTLKAYGNEVCQTPSLDHLASQGMTFYAAYHMGSWSGAVCTPSRHMIMTGRSVWHIPGKKQPPRNSRPPRIPGNPNESNQRLVPPDLANDPRYADVRKDLEATLLAEQKRFDDPYRLWDQPIAD